MTLSPDYIQAAGECFAENVSPPVPFDSASAHECWSILTDALPAPITPGLLSALDDMALARLADAFGAAFECEPPTTAQLRQTIEDLEFRWGEDPTDKRRALFALPHRSPRDGVAMSNPGPTFDMAALAQTAPSLLSGLTSGQEQMLAAVRRRILDFAGQGRCRLGSPATPRIWRTIGNVAVHHQLEAMPVPTIRRDDSALFTIEPDAYAQWPAKLGLEVDPVELHGLLRTAAELLVDAPIHVQPSPNGCVAEVVDASGEPLDWEQEALVSHLVVLAALLLPEAA